MLNHESSTIGSPAASLSPIERKEASRPHSKFSPEEDERLKVLVTEFGDNDWTSIANEMPGRNVRQCKERWMYYLSPSINTAPWTKEEDNLLLLKQREFGSKWVKIAKFFENRTDAMVKNRFNVLQRKERKRHELVLRNLTALQCQRMLPQLWRFNMMLQQQQMILHQQQQLLLQQQKERAVEAKRQEEEKIYEMNIQGCDNECGVLESESDLSFEDVWCSSWEGENDFDLFC